MIGKKIRIDLSSFDDAWKDCFLLFRALGHQENSDLQRKLHVETREIARIERDSTDIAKAIRNARINDEPLEKLYKKQDELSDALEDRGHSTLNVITDMLKSKLLGGSVIDEDGKRRDAKADDLDDLPSSMLQDIAREVQGAVSKNA